MRWTSSTSAITCRLRLSSRAARGVTDGDTDFINFQKTQQALVKSYAVLHAALEKPEVTAGEGIKPAHLRQRLSRLLKKVRQQIREGIVAGDFTF